jgi:hypothetical protein
LAGNGLRGDLERERRLWIVGLDALSIDELTRLAKQGVALQGGDWIEALKTAKEAVERKKRRRGAVARPRSGPLRGALLLHVIPLAPDC